MGTISIRDKKKTNINDLSSVAWIQIHYYVTHFIFSTLHTGLFRFLRKTLCVSAVHTHPSYSRICDDAHRIICTVHNCVRYNIVYYILREKLINRIFHARNVSENSRFYILRTVVWYVRACSIRLYIGYNILLYVSALLRGFSFRTLIF